MDILYPAKLTKVPKGFWSGLCVMKLGALIRQWRVQSDTNQCFYQDNNCIGYRRLHGK